MKYYTIRYISCGRWYLGLYLGGSMIGSWNLLDDKDYGQKWRRAMLRMDDHWNNSINKLNMRLQEK